MTKRRKTPKRSKTKRKKVKRKAVKKKTVKRKVQSKRKKSVKRTKAERSRAAKFGWQIRRIRELGAALSESEKLRQELEAKLRHKEQMAEAAAARKARTLQGRASRKEYYQDPDAYKQGIRAQMITTWNNDPTGIPDFIRDTYDIMLDVGLGEEITEYDLWDMYKET